MAIHTGDQIQDDLNLSCDVCVVGSGAGGAVVAARLTEAGRSVIVLEEGGFETSDTFDMTEANMVPRLYQEKGQRATSDLSIVVVQGRAVGGTTVINWTTCFRTPPHVVSHWNEYHGVEGPTYETLIPHWERIEKRLNIHQMKPEQMNRNNRNLWDGARKLGWKVEMLYRNVDTCAHTGYCGVGCPIDAKQSMLVTFLPDAVKAGAEIYANAWVERVERDGRRIAKVIARVRDPKTDQPTGRSITVNAKHVVLSGGAINTPALLLRSEIDPNGRTGKRTFLHPAVGAAGVYADPIDAFTGSPQYCACHEFVHREPGKMTFLIEPGPIFPVADSTFHFEFGADAQRWEDTMPYRSTIGALLHDGFDMNDPEEGATVTVRPDGRPKVDYKWTPRLKEGMREALKRTSQAHLAAGATEVWSYTRRPVIMRSERDLGLLDEIPVEPLDLAVFSAHVMGGCQMGADPKTSVIDSKTLRHHDLDNLFVIDGSVFPTSCTVNPQVSIYGIASWGAEHVVAAS